MTPNNIDPRLLVKADRPADIAPPAGTPATGWVPPPLPAEQAADSMRFSQLMTAGAENMVTESPELPRPEMLSIALAEAEAKAASEGAALADHPQGLDTAGDAAMPGAEAEITAQTDGAAADGVASAPAQEPGVLTASQVQTRNYKRKALGLDGGLTGHLRKADEVTASVTRAGPVREKDGPADAAAAAAAAASASTAANRPTVVAPSVDSSTARPTASGPMPTRTAPVDVSPQRLHAASVSHAPDSLPATASLRSAAVPSDSRTPAPEAAVAAPDITPVAAEASASDVPAASPIAQDASAAKQVSDIPPDASLSAEASPRRPDRTELDAPVKVAPGAAPAEVQLQRQQQVAEAAVAEIVAMEVHIAAINTPESLPLEVLKAL